MPQFIYPHFQEILTVESGNHSSDPLVGDFYETIVAVTQSATEPTVDVLARTIMTYMGYPLLSSVGESMATVSMQHQTYFTMSGGKAGAHMDLALVDESRSLLCLFVEDKQLDTTTSSKHTTVPMDWPHPQVIAHALGAYSANLIEAHEVAQLQENANSEIGWCLGTEFFNMVHSSLFFERIKLTYTYV